VEGTGLARLRFPRCSLGPVLAGFAHGMMEGPADDADPLLGQDLPGVTCGADAFNPRSFQPGRASSPSSSSGLKASRDDLIRFRTS
jgi:hypothetical protein